MDDLSIALVAFEGAEEQDVEPGFRIFRLIGPSRSLISQIPRSPRTSTPTSTTTNSTTSRRHWMPSMTCAETAA